jgi:hypothetical protein
MTPPPDHEIILGSYVRAEGRLTLEQLHAIFSRIEERRLDTARATLERLGFIESMPGGGHRITESGLRHWHEED